MKKILVPIDYSENTDNAVKAACDLAKALDCGVVLLHSYFEALLMQGLNMVNNMDTIPIINPESDEILREQNEKEIRKWEEWNSYEYPGVSIESVVTAMELRDKIKELSDNEDVLMIVMSATGAGKKDSFSGSAASGLFDSAPVPIVAIPENYAYHRDALFANILYVTDFSDLAHDEIRFIIDHFLGNINRLYCCHLSFKEKGVDEAFAKMAELKRAFLAEEEIGKVVFKIIETDDVEETLETLADNKEIGMISFHEHNRNIFYRFFHRSVVKKNILRFHIPLLVFRKFSEN